MCPKHAAIYLSVLCDSCYSHCWRWTQLRRGKRKNKLVNSPSFSQISWQHYILKWWVISFQSLQISSFLDHSWLSFRDSVLEIYLHLFIYRRGRCCQQEQPGWCRGIMHLGLFLADGKGVWEDKSPQVSQVSAHLTRRAPTGLSSGLSFQGCLCSKCPWMIEIVFPDGVQGWQVWLDPWRVESPKLEVPWLTV